MSSGKRFSAKVAEQRREQNTQQSNWLEGTSKVFEVTYPSGATENNITLWFFLCPPSPRHIRPDAADAEAEL